MTTLAQQLTRNKIAKIESVIEMYKKNLVSTANEIIKIVLKALNDNIDDKENPTEIKWNYDKHDNMCINITLTKKDVDMLNTILTGKLSVQCIRENRKMYWDMLTFRELKDEKNVGDILQDQFKIFGFNYFSKMTQITDDILDQRQCYIDLYVPKSQ